MKFGTYRIYKQSLSMVTASMQKYNDRWQLKPKIHL